MALAENQNENRNRNERIVAGYIAWINTNFNNHNANVPGLVEHVDADNDQISGKLLKTFFSL